MTTNQDLHQLYEAGYAAGNTWHTPVDTWEESLLIHEMGGDWRGKTVLEIGCGEGRLAAYIAISGADDVTAIDYSNSAISAAEERYRIRNLGFECTPLRPISCHFNTIIMQGVLEHQSDWRQCLSDPLQHTDCLITSSPSFLNPRGYVWQTLRLLLGVPMSLSDLHAINPFDMVAWCKDNGYTCEYRSCHHDWAAGKTMLADYEKRLPNALRDAGLDTSRVDSLLDWLRQAGQYYVPTDWSGATVVYKITRGA